MSGIKRSLILPNAGTAIEDAEGPDFAGKLAEQSVLQSHAQQQDFGNHYFGSQIAPNWTAMLQAWKEAGVGRIQEVPGGTDGLSRDQGLGYGPPKDAALLGLMRANIAAHNRQG